MNFLQQLRGVAIVLGNEEERLRRAAHNRLAALAHRRQCAHRRYHLLAAMAEAARVPERDAATAAAIARFERETGIHPGVGGYAELNAELRLLAAEIHAALHGEAADPIGRFAALEAWYRQRFGRDLLALLDSSEPEFRPSVDF
jgi:hypothetical protein